MSEKNQKKTISKEFINMEIENEETKKESSKDNLLSGLSEIAQSNQNSTKAQSSLSNISQFEPKEDQKEEEDQKEKVSIIHLEEKQIQCKNTDEESNNSPVALDPQYQNDIDECLNRPNDSLAQMSIPMEEEPEEINFNENNIEQFEDVYDLNPLENNIYDNRNLIPIQQWERPEFINKKEDSLRDDDKLGGADFNVDSNRPQPLILFEEEPITTINYDDMPFDGGHNDINATNYATEDDQG